MPALRASGKHPLGPERRMLNAKGSQQVPTKAVGSTGGCPLGYLTLWVGQSSLCRAGSGR